MIEKVGSTVDRWMGEWVHYNEVNLNNIIPKTIIVKHLASLSDKRVNSLTHLLTHSHAC